MRSIVAVWMVAAIAGCAHEASGPVCRNPAPGAGELGVGSKATGFVAVADGASVAVISGPVGPPIVIVSLRMRGFELPDADLPLALRIGIRFEGRVIGGTVAEVRPTSVAGANVEFVGVQTLLNVVDVNTFLDDAHVCDVTAELADGCGRVVVAARKLRFHR